MTSIQRKRKGIRRVYSCLFCGVRVGAAKSAFCHVDAKAYGIKLVSIRLHGLHYFQWSKISDGYFSESIDFMIKELKPNA